MGECANLTFGQIFLITFKNFEKRQNWSKNYRFAANILRKEIWSDFKVEAQHCIKTKYHSQFWNGVLDLGGEI